MLSDEAQDGLSQRIAKVSQSLSKLEMVHARDGGINASHTHSQQTLWGKRNEIVSTHSVPELAS